MTRSIGHMSWELSCLVKVSKTEKYQMSNESIICRLFMTSFVLTAACSVWLFFQLQYVFLKLMIRLPLEARNNIINLLDNLNLEKSSVPEVKNTSKVCLSIIIKIQGYMGYTTGQRGLFKTMFFHNS